MNNNHRVRIFLRGISSEELTWNLARQTPGMVNDIYRGIHFVSDESYHYAVMLNEGFDVLTPAACNACFLMEPPDKFKPQPHWSIGALYSFNPADHLAFGDAFVYHHMLSFLHTQVLVEEAPTPSQKRHFMSMVVSGKTDLPFQAKRLKLAEALLASDLPIDFFGRDWQTRRDEPRIKGPLPRMDKTAALRDYACSLAFENSPQVGYLTEKFVDCIANNCIPFTNNRTPIEHFPDGSFVYLDFSLSIPQLVERIRKLHLDRRWLERPGISKAKHQVLAGNWSFAEAIVRFVHQRAAAPAWKGGHSKLSVSSLIASPLRHPESAMTAAVNTSSSFTKEANAVTSVISVLFLSCRRLHYLRRTVDAIRRHLREVEPDVTAVFLALDNGSSPEDQRELAGMGFDLLTMASKNLGIGPAMNHLVSQVRTPFVLNLQDDWEVTNPKGVPFLHEAMAIMRSDARIAHIKLDNYHFLDFSDRTTYDGPFQAPEGTVPFFCQNPQMLWGGFSFPPALTRTAALHELGPFREDKPFQRGWAESEYTQRYATRFVAAKSPEMLVFSHIGIESTKGWTAAENNEAAVLLGAATVEFVIPYRKDTSDRAENLDVVVRYLEHHARAHGWKATITVQQSSPNEEREPFWKARLINDAMRASKAEIVAIIDADVLVPPKQMSQAIAHLAAGGDVCYPYEGAFLNVPRIYIPRLLGDFQADTLPADRFENLNPGSFGGAVLFRRSAFWAGGGMNEHFRSWGREDVEVHDRFVKLGYECRRIPGPIFHLDHARTVDSRSDNPHYQSNVAEHDRIMSLDAHQLRDEISTWEWIRGDA